MQEKSTFVTVLAWICIVFSGMGLFGMLMEWIVFSLMPFDRIIAQSQQHAHNAGAVPAAYFVTFFRWMLAVGVAFQIWILSSSIGLLLRKNWARISFIVFLIFSLGINAIYLLLEIIALIVFSVLPMHNIPQGMHGFMLVFFLFMMIFTIGFIVLFGWILRKLQSADIRREFIPEPDPAG